MKKWLFSLMVCLAIMMPAVVLAQTTGPVNVYINEIGAELGLGTRDVRLVIASIINVALGLLGIVAVVIIIYGGLTWMTAGGDQKKVDSAKHILTAGIIGLIIILSAYAIARFVVSSLLTATTQ
jgi:hypothetical protein